MMLQLTKNFVLYEYFISEKYPELARKMAITAMDEYKCFLLAKLYQQPVRTHFGVKIGNTSGKRDTKLNRAVGGVPTSEHRFRKMSAAVDWKFLAEDGKTTHPDNSHLLEEAVVWMCQNLGKSWGQLIVYYDTDFTACNIHLSLPTPEHQGEVLVKLSNQKYYHWDDYKRV